MANLLHHNNNYIKKDDHLMPNSGYQVEDFQPTGLYRIREDEEHLLNLAESSKPFNKNSYLLSKFSNESLYSFSYSSNSGDYQKLSSRLDIYNRNNSYINGLLSAGLRKPSPLVNSFVSKVNNFISTAENENLKPKFNHFLSNKIQDENKLNVPGPIGNIDKKDGSSNINIIIEEEPSDNNDQKTTSTENLQASPGISSSKKLLGGPKLNLNINTQNLNVNNKGYAPTPTICNYRSPLRISEQSQATITTDGHLKILTINDIFCGLIKNNSKNKIVGKSVIDILFGSTKDNENDDTEKIEMSNDSKDKNINRFTDSIKKFSEKHLKHQKNSIINIIQSDQEKAADYVNESDSEKYLRDKVLICGQVVRKHG
ncbi:hypothetical protein PIROE2DRAFT_6540 [Piromyces sp. E2]|nr:hypothetical protein PIROE2DRAFT_6540 [Piromyces sp. E2]|eukprot:OUM66302.1 hypothetical protein PIROE2DRAFT_6540 [Piromyces sp. E2]